MIKNLVPELEKFLFTGSADASTSLAELLNEFGIEHQLEGEKIRLAETLEVLEPDAILAHMQSESGAMPVRLEIHRQIDSTNEAVMKSLDGQIPLACLAEMQTAGKGRRGRNWVSPFGKNVYLTLGRFLQGPLSALEGLSLVIGMEAVDTLRELGVADTGLKWPNDILLDGGKLGGILVELKPPSAAGIGVVMGIGINLAMDQRAALEIDQPWSAASAKTEISRNKLAGLLIGRLLKAVQRFDQYGFGEFSDRWNDYNIYAGQKVNIIRGEEVFTGIDRGVDDAGNLLLETAAGLQVHNSGEVSLRPA